MLVLWILLVLFMSLLLLLLFAPVKFRIDSTRGIAEVKALLVVKGGLLIEQNTLWLRLVIFGFTRKWNLLEMIARSENNTAEEVAKDQEKPAQHRPGKPKKMPPFRKIKAMIKSFRVEEFVLRLDTGDNALNGILFPVFYWLGQWFGKTIEINFVDRNELILEVSNTPARILYAYIRS